MQLRNLFLLAGMIAFASPALATVKVYNAVPPGGTVGDRFLFSTSVCPTVAPSPGTVQGVYELTDTGGGSVSMTDFDLREVTLTNFPPGSLTGVFGPGAFVFVNATPTITTSALPVTVSGSTAPSGSVAWGIISGFSSTGISFCIASPQTICTGGAMVPHGVTSPLGPINSPTYDLGTWSFDSVGDLSASNYISRTTNGGTSNGQRLVRGAYVGSSVPALPLVGAGVLALGLAVAGTRSVLRKK